MKTYAVIFDLDGTILDTLEDLKNSTNRALAGEGLPERSKEEVRAFVGNGIRKLIERAVPEGTDPLKTDCVFEAFKMDYKNHCMDETKPYQGIEELLKRLRQKGILTAVVSNKADFAVQDLCLRYFPGMLDASVGEKEGVRRKPAPDSVLTVMKELKAEAALAVYVGDSEVDIETAKNAGLPCISVDWGFKSREFLVSHGASCIVSDSEMLYQKIMELAELS